MLIEQKWGEAAPIEDFLFENSWPEKV